MIDLHSHLLPGVDDGSRSLEQSRTVLSRLAEQGLVGICLTPHLLASQAPAGFPEAHDWAYKTLCQVLPEGLRVYRGAEVMLDRPLETRVGQERRVTLNGSRYLLVEFPRMVAAQTVEHALALVVATGLVPLVAHPERYRCCRPENALRWKGLGALLQVDGPTLLSPRPRGDRARELVSAGLADIAAADNHGDERSLRPVRDALIEMEGQAQAHLLLSANPQAILEDREVEQVPPFGWRFSFLERLRALLDRTGEDRL